MQTFLPYSNFLLSAAALDYKRLGKQRSEAKIIFKASFGLYPSGAWRNHPATRMWEPYRWALAKYGRIICTEWIARGYKDTMLDWFRCQEAAMAQFGTDMPPWIGDQRFHDSHKSNLIRKLPKFYNMYQWNVPDNLPYVWPI